MKKTVILCITIVVILMGILVSAGYINNSRRSHSLNVVCVQTSEDATEIGRVICKRIYPEFDYSKYEWECIYDKNNSTWRVCCYEEGKNILGGGLP